jgi:hypothetical protein
VNVTSSSFSSNSVRTEISEVAAHSLSGWSMSRPAHAPGPRTLGRDRQASCEAGPRRAFEKAVAERHYYHSYGVPHFYRGQALKKLGRREEAKPLFEVLVETGTRELAEIETSTGISFFAKFGDPGRPPRHLQPLGPGHALPD